LNNIKKEKFPALCRDLHPSRQSFDNFVTLPDGLLSFQETPEYHLSRVAGIRGLEDLIKKEKFPDLSSRSLKGEIPGKSSAFETASSLAARS